MQCRDEARCIFQSIWLRFLSRPVIRGQMALGLKCCNMLQKLPMCLCFHQTTTLSLSYPILAKQVEIISRPSTLLYGAGTVGGLVDVTDQKIPTQMPNNGLETTGLGLRYNTGSDES